MKKYGAILLNLTIIVIFCNNILLAQSPEQKNKFDFGISMEFENYQNYEQYSNHKNRLLFIKQYWIKDVEDFIETDYESLQ